MTPCTSTHHSIANSDLNLARVLAARKCSTENCWCFAAHGYILCNHCLHGGCLTITGGYRTRIEKALATIAKATSPKEVTP